MKLELHNAVIESVSTRKDRSYKVVLGLPELPPEEAAKLFASLQTEVVTVDVEAIPEDGGKSPSQRMRAVLFLLWQQDFKPTYKEFETFYRSWMERKIEAIKQSLNDLT